MRLTRRNLAPLLAAPLVLRAVGAEAQALTKVRLQLGWIANVQYAGEWLALEHGLFRRRGIEVEWYPGGPNALPGPVMLAAGRADLGYTAWFPLLDAVARNNDLVMIAAVFPNNPLGVLSLPRKPIRAAADLVGARILAQGPNEKTAIDATLALNNLPVRWTQVPAGFSPEPLLAGDGDGYTAFSTNQVITLEAMGLVRDRDFFFTAFDQMGFRSYGAVLAATRPYIASNRAQIVGFLQGLIQGLDENERDPMLAAKLVTEKYGRDFGLDLVQQQRQNVAQIPLAKHAEAGRPRLALIKEQVEGPLYAAARATGRNNLPDVNRLCDFSLVEEAHRGL